jgi:hypothetical protein
MVEEWKEEVECTGGRDVDGGHCGGIGAQGHESDDGNQELYKLGHPAWPFTSCVGGLKNGALPCDALPIMTAEIRLLLVGCAVWA